MACTLPTEKEFSGPLVEKNLAKRFPVHKITNARAGEFLLIETLTEPLYIDSTERGR
jgi:hypothetical protein